MDFDALEDEEEAQRPLAPAGFDGDWECLVDYYRTGELVELSMSIYGPTGHYHVNGQSHRLWDISVSHGRHGLGGAMSATFRWVNRNGAAGKGKWTLEKSGNALRGSWTLDSSSDGSWSWNGHRKGSKEACGQTATAGAAAMPSLDGPWDCSCDFFRTGQPIRFVLTIKGSGGSYSAGGGNHHVSDIELSRAGGATRVTFRWTQRASGSVAKGSGAWTLLPQGRLEGGWTQDGLDGGPWVWNCTRQSQQPVARALEARPTSRRQTALDLDGYMGEVDVALDNLPALQKAYAQLRVGRDRPVWGEEELQELPGLDNMRAGAYNMFVWQTQEDQDCQAASDALFAAGGRDFFEKTEEDGGEGVLTVSVQRPQGGEMLVSRDLLDSVSEMMFLEKSGVLAREEAATVIDIGAGYGRLARRMADVFPNITYYATDGIPESTYFAHHYLMRHRSRARVVPLNRVGLLLPTQPKLAVNVHSFSEQSEEDVAFWVALMAKCGATYFFVVPNSSVDKIMFFNGRKAPLNPIMENAGYRLHSVGSHYGMGRFQDKYFLWVLDKAE